MLASVLSLALLGGCSTEKSISLPDYSEYVTLGEYTGMTYNITDTSVSDETLDARLESFASSLATTEEVTDRAVEDGDVVNIDYVGTVDGEEFENTAGAGTNLTIGSHSYIDDFEEQLIGSNIGDVVTVEVTFPEDYGEDGTEKGELNGKDAVFEVTINTISIQVVPELTDELIATNTEYATIEEYRQYIYDSLAAQYEENAKALKQSDIIENVIENAEFSAYPEEEVQELVDQTITTAQSEAEAYGIDIEMYLTYFYGCSTETEFESMVAEQARSYIEQKMVLCEIAKAEGITVTKDEVEAYAQQMVEDYGLESVDVVYEYYTDSELAYFVVSDKVIEFLEESAVGVEAEATTEETATEEDASGEETSTEEGTSDEDAISEEETSEEATTTEESTASEESE